MNECRPPTKATVENITLLVYLSAFDSPLEPRFHFWLNYVCFESSGTRLSEAAPTGTANFRVRSH
jgi:hypothetical protein